MPVDTQAMGVRPQSTATARWVPSPPSTTMAATPSATIARTARRVSSTVPVTGNSRWRTGANRSAPVLRARSRPRSTWARMPPRSGIAITSETPQAPRHASTRSTMFARSVI